ncbi:hypothetical protein FRC10_001658 [Ceratobasidium sp. 414]|nr:hypothetical protein FRC10_001658 [Ceratobasidium sp. 414]
MSQSGSADNPTGGHHASPQAFASAVAETFAQQVAQPLENRLQAHDQRFSEFESRNTEFQNSVLALLSGGGPPLPGPSARADSSTRRRGSTVPRPDKNSEKLMQNVVRHVLTAGCCIERLKDAQLGLTEGELEERISNDPPLPWRPDFLKLISDPANKFWLGKILPEVMKDTKALDHVASRRIAQEFWTEDCICKRILGPMWNNIRKEVKKRVDAEAEARGKANRSKGNRDGRSKRLYSARLKLATGTDKHPRFQCKINGEMRHIPVDLMVEDVMSDVVEEEYDSDSIPPEVTHDEYQKKRTPFEYEGVPPFFRRKEPWNQIFAAMDGITSSKTRGFGIQPRYYAGDVTRGQRNVSADMVTEIPTSVLYRCHISKEWYGRLSEAQRDVLKRSPAGWEVDEERSAGASG